MDEEWRGPPDQIEDDVIEEALGAGGGHFVSGFSERFFLLEPERDAMEDPDPGAGVAPVSANGMLSSRGNIE